MFTELLLHPKLVVITKEYLYFIYKCRPVDLIFNMQKYGDPFGWEWDSLDDMDNYKVGQASCHCWYLFYTQIDNKKKIHYRFLPTSLINDCCYAPKHILQILLVFFKSRFGWGCFVPLFIR